MDIVDPQTRSRMMSGIRSQNTQPEVLVRKMLHARGFRFRLHPRNVPGRPDIVLPKHKAVVFVHGCFWHKHECYLFKWPRTHADFWKLKLTRNELRDANNQTRLVRLGWRVCVVWECSFRSKPIELERVADRLSTWLTSSKRKLYIP